MPATLARLLHVTLPPLAPLLLDCHRPVSPRRAFGVLVPCKPWCASLPLPHPHLPRTQLTTLPPAYRATKESPRTFFDFFVKRYGDKPPSMIVYDHACGLAEYALNRLPHLFRNTRFRVDVFHWPNHVACSEAFNFEAFRASDPSYLWNTNVAEQFNRRMVSSSRLWLLGVRQLQPMSPQRSRSPSLPEEVQAPACLHGLAERRGVPGSSSPRLRSYF